MGAGKESLWQQELLGCYLTMQDLPSGGAAAVAVAGAAAAVKSLRPPRGRISGGDAAAADAVAPSAAVLPLLSGLLPGTPLSALRQVAACIGG